MDAANFTIPVLSTAKILFPQIVQRLVIHSNEPSALLLDSLLSKSTKTLPHVAVVPLKAPKKDSSSEDLLNAVSKNSNSTTTILDAKDLFGFGVLARILKCSKASSIEIQNTGVKYILMLEGISRLKIEKLTKKSAWFDAHVSHLQEDDIDQNDVELQALILNLRKSGHALSQVLSQLQLPPAVLEQLRKMLDSTPPGQLADLFASMIDMSPDERLQILSTAPLKPRLTATLALLTRQIQVLKISQRLQNNIDANIGSKQREFFLRQQLAAIQKELGESDDEKDDTADLQSRVVSAGMQGQALKSATRELNRLKRMQPASAEYQVIRTYLETLAELPWNISTGDILDISKARLQLDSDHYGLGKVKTRVLEFLAVRKLKSDLKGPILCLVGPPGVGKTSLGRSVAAALGRKFFRVALGGVRDEAEVRGHRRTYVGAMPGLIVGALRKCGSNNPVILLDEIDKLGRDFKGDPSAALLEVLDPEQNHMFTDHYLNVPFDLSNVLFIATANETDSIPSPLLDRMELITIPGYTFEEKLHISKRHLLPKQITAHGLTESQLDIKDNEILRIATSYTREAGVRTLERHIAAVCRAVAVDFTHTLENPNVGFDPIVTTSRVLKILGPVVFEDDETEMIPTPGVVTGLAYTASGAGGILLIEATQMPGTGVLHLTGKLGDVIKESAQIALSWLRSNSHHLVLNLGPATKLLDGVDVHIHFPAGATPKDGPSAGVTIVTALVSLFSGVPVIPHTAMTGEVTLKGKVLPVGGVKEKLMAAHRGGVKRVLVPERNRADVEEVGEEVRAALEVVFVRDVWEVLDAAFGYGIVGRKRDLVKENGVLKSNEILVWDREGRARM
ncbi:hypothetical protein HK096_001398 [Nowakowskiella sp. JEL0078]|nr:hypothetical protein HK096_001398 [Nowakowskiella sp. JEL0078]